jgi:hypothetical protein
MALRIEAPVTTSSLLLAPHHFEIDQIRRQLGNIFESRTWRFRAPASTICDETIRWTGALDDEVGFVHSFCANAKLVGKEIFRRLANEVLEFADEVCLIGQATGVGDLRP